MQITLHIPDKQYDYLNQQNINLNELFNQFINEKIEQEALKSITNKLKNKNLSKAQVQQDKIILEKNEMLEAWLNENE